MERPTISLPTSIKSINSNNLFNPVDRLRLSRFLSFSFLLLLFTSFVAPAFAAASNSSTLVWPAPPDQPRIAYVRSIAGPADLGVKRGFWAKLGNWLAGNRRASEQLIKPFAVALDEQGNLCFTDTGANVVCYFDRTHKTWRRWEKVGDVRFASPVGVAKHGRTIYVADSALGCVVVFDEKGKLERQIHEGLRRPAGVAIAGKHLFVVDPPRQAVFIFDLEGHPAGQFGQRGVGPGEFNLPTHIAADFQGELLVTDSMNGRIQVFSQQGRFLRQVGSMGDAPGHFSRPKAAATDSFGHLYVIDALFDNIQLFNREGQLLMALGQAGNGPGEFWLPNGIAISSNNEIYVADCYNHRLQVFKFIGQP